MPNVATALKAEIARIARKEVRAEAGSLKKSSTAHRSDIAALKRRCLELEKLVKRLSRAPQGGRRARKDLAESEGGAAEGLRFRPAGFAGHRKRLGLSAAEFGRLIGVSGQSVYLWESGRAKPRARQLAAIAEARKLGKREAAAKLAALQQGSE